MKATRAFVRAPSAHLAEGELTHIARRPLDLPRALQQYEAYLTVLRQHGLSLHMLPELPDHADGLFVEDTLLMIDDQAVLTLPGAPSRRGELPSVAQTLTELGLPFARIAPPATLDGGDVLVLARHILVGLGTRSTAPAAQQLQRLLGSRRAVSTLGVHGALHLKTAVTALPDGSLVAVPGRVDLSALRALGYRVHPAEEPSGGDVLCLGQSVLLPADAPHTATMLRKQGFLVLELDISELQKLEAGVTCMSVLF